MNEIFWWISFEGYTAMQHRFHTMSPSMLGEFKEGFKQEQLDHKRNHQLDHENDENSSHNLLNIQNGIAIIEITGIIHIS